MSGRATRVIVAALGAVVLLVVMGASLFSGGASNAKVGAFSPHSTPASRVSAQLRPVRPRGISPSSSPVAAARAWLAQNPQVLAGTPVEAMQVSRTGAGVASGQTIVRFNEVHDGAVVLGGQAVLAVDGDRKVAAASSETLQGAVPSSDAQVTAAQARRIAVAWAIGSGGNADVTATAGVKAIYDPRILGGPGAPGGRLVWEFVVSRSGANPLRRQVMVDAQTGHIALSIDMIETALSRRVCDANSKAAQVPCTTAVRSEGGAPSSITDANNAYDFAGKTWSFYSGLGRDSVDGKGLRLDSTIRYCPSKSNCPYGNAYWNGSQMVYGSGYASADDVVAHELTHGVTQYESNLFYYYQSGAINEALSDIFGEFVDQTDGVGTDTAAVKWKIGEDLPGGSIRDMSNPPAFNDPDRMGSSLYAADATGSDSGGVHTNSGVANKAAFLLTDGATFNGRTVSGIGITKASKIWYQAALLLRSASDYSDLAVTLPQACRSIIGTAGITESDCVAADNAVAATEMSTPPVNAPNVKPAACTSSSPVNTWSDDFEGASSNRWVKRTLSGAANWNYASDTGVDGPYATSGTNNLWADDSVNRSDTAIEMPTSVAVPSGAYMYFKHAFGFEQQSPGYAGTGDSGYYDGGVVEYSSNNGSTWTDAGSLMDAGGYGGALSTVSDSPLQGRQAFVGQSHGYVATRLGLSSLAGKSVKFRFRMATDTANDNWSWSTNGSPKGWFIDDVSICTCGSVTPPDTTPPDTSISSGPSGTVASASASFEFSASEQGSSFECSFDGDAYGSCVSPKAYSGLSQGVHTFSVRATDAAGNVDASPATRSFTVDTVAPDTSITAGPSGPVSNSSPAFGFSASEPATTFQCALDSGAYASCASPKAYSTLSQGAHTFKVRAVDAAGNIDASPATRSFSVDTIAPDTRILSGPSSTTDPKPVFTFDSIQTDRWYYECALDASVWKICTSPWSPAVGLSKGTHVFKVRAIDFAGNIDATPATRTVVIR